MPDGLAQLTQSFWGMNSTGMHPSMREYAAQRERSAVNQQLMNNMAEMRGRHGVQAIASWIPAEHRAEFQSFMSSPSTLRAMGTLAPMHPIVDMFLGGTGNYMRLGGGALALTQGGIFGAGTSPLFGQGVTQANLAAEIVRKIDEQFVTASGTMGRRARGFNMGEIGDVLGGLGDRGAFAGRSLGSLSASGVFELSPTFEQDFQKIAESSLKTIRVLKDTFGNRSIQELMTMGESLSGIAFDSESGARRIGDVMGRIRAAGETYGMDPQSLMQLSGEITQMGMGMGLSHGTAAQLASDSIPGAVMRSRMLQVHSNARSQDYFMRSSVGDVAGAAVRLQTRAMYTDSGRALLAMQEMVQTGVITDPDLAQRIMSPGALENANSLMAEVRRTTGVDPLATYQFRSVEEVSDSLAASSVGMGAFTDAVRTSNARQARQVIRQNVVPSLVQGVGNQAIAGDLLTTYAPETLSKILSALQSGDIAGATAIMEASGAGVVDLSSITDAQAFASQTRQAQVAVAGNATFASTPYSLEQAATDRVREMTIASVGSAILNDLANEGGLAALIKGVREGLHGTDTSAISTGVLAGAGLLHNFESVGGGSITAADIEAASNIRLDDGRTLLEAVGGAEGLEAARKSGTVASLLARSGYSRVEVDGSGRLVKTSEHRAVQEMVERFANVGVVEAQLGDAAKGLLSDIDLQGIIASQGVKGAEEAVSESITNRLNDFLRRDGGDILADLNTLMNTNDPLIRGASEQLARELLEDESLDEKTRKGVADMLVRDQLEVQGRLILETADGSMFAEAILKAVRAAQGEGE